jgi:hypothetical protein
MYSVVISIERGEDIPVEVVSNSLTFHDLGTAEAVFVEVEEALYRREDLSFYTPASPSSE